MEVTLVGPILVASFVDSTGLGAIVSALKQVGNGELALCNVQSAALTVFNLTRMDKVFRVFPTRDAALTALGSV